MTFHDVVIATLVGNGISAAALAFVVQFILPKEKDK